MKRRNLSLSMAGTIGIGLTAATSATSRKPYSRYASKWFDEFPNSLQGAIKIDKVIRTPDAHYVLVHIRQRHLRSSVANRGSVKAVQNDIYKIVSDLVSRGLIDGIYLEGAGNDITDFLSRAENERGNESFMQSCRDDSPKLICDEAWFRLWAEGKIDVYAAETDEANNKGNEAFDNWIESMKGKKGAAISVPYAVTEDRENILLNLIKSKKSIAVTIYGADHDFTNNVLEWNRKHPHAKFSSIVITPESLETKNGNRN